MFDASKKQLAHVAPAYAAILWGPGTNWGISLAH